MRNWTGIAGLFFGASLAVYSGQANPLFAAGVAGRDGQSNDVKLIDDAKAVASQTNAGTAANAAAVAQNALDPFASASPAPLSDADTTSIPALPSSSSPATSPSVVPLGDSVGGTVAGSGAGQSVSATQVSVSDAGTVEIHVNDANLLEVLRMLSLQSQRNIIASKEVAGTITANLYNVTVREALDAILHANGYAYRERGNFIFVYTTKELIDLDKQARQMNTQVFHLFYTPAVNAANMIKPVLSAEAQVAFTAAAIVGIDQKGTKDTGGNSYASEDTIVVTDYADNLEKVKKILKDVDHRPQQILIEATILRATLSDDNALGVDFSVMGGVKFNQILSTPAQTINNAAGGNLTNAASGAGQGSYGIGQTDFTRQLPPGGLRVGYLTNNISVFVQALESVANTVVLANPKVLALDKQKGEVIIGRKDGYLTSTVTETAKVETIEFLDTGTRLVFRPFIGDDGYVRMEIHPEDSSGGLTSANLPFKVTTEVTSNVMVKDGHTIVIGGLFRESSDSSRGQVPGLGNIPFLGALFRQQRDRTTREEVIILLTPHIIKDDSAYSQLADDAMKKAEEYRVGVRKGMMFFGRERLAETAYQNAQAALNQAEPNRNLALWHLGIATNLNPQFIEAIELKEKLNGKHVTSVDNSTIRTFVTRSMLADNGPLNQRPAVIDVPGRGMPMPGSNPTDVPTSQPAAVIPVMEANPTTQPATPPTTQMVLAEPATRPSTQPVLAEASNGPATRPVTETAKADSSSSATELPSIAGAPATQPVVAEVTANPTSVVTAIADESPDESTDGLSSAARNLAYAALKMANAADDLSRYAGSKSTKARPTRMPTTQRSKPASTITALPMDDAK